MIQGVIEILLDDSIVRNLVGLNLAGDKYKIFPVVCPQGEIPKYILGIKNSTLPVDCKGSVSVYDQVSFSLLHYGTNYIDVDEMHEATRRTLDGRGFITDNGITFDEIRFVTDRDLFDNAAQYYLRQSDYLAIVKREIS